jgi:predicted Fe-S protein YdhL (DUF1289 family)
VNAAADDDDVMATIEERAAGVAALPAGESVPSPCINVCRIDPASGLCAGCRRTLDEIAAWSRLDDTGKRVVWAQLARRAHA